jgi:hypothetical protein
MADFHLRRRIPPKPVPELIEELMSDVALSRFDAETLAIQMHTHAMEELYRLARIGEAFERMPPFTEASLAQVVDADTVPHWGQYWIGLGDGWNAARQWVTDNVEEA